MNRSSRKAADGTTIQCNADDGRVRWIFDPIDDVGPLAHPRDVTPEDLFKMSKRAFDLVASLAGLVVLSPVMLLVAIAIVIESGWPILYRAERTGLHGAPFKIVKFRSMRPAGSSSHSHHSGDDDPRITRVGRFIRKYKFDELPQLLNVVTGKMSLVGPRPETTEYTRLYSEEEMIIFSVRPGITDEASIVFADLGSILSGGDPDALYFERVWARKMELRMKYVRERSFIGDLSLIFRTLAAPFRKTGTSV